MKNINKFLLSIAILLNFSIVNAEEIQEVMSLDDISREIIGEKVQAKKTSPNKENKINKKVDEKIEKKGKKVEIANINTEKENKKVEEEAYVEDEPEQKIDKASIVDIYDKKVIDKIAYKKGSESTPFTGTFGVVIEDNIEYIEQYENGLLNGETAYFSKDKGIKLLSEMYTKGKLNGKQRSYYNNGKLKSIVYYVNDRVNGIEAYDKNGKLLHRSLFKDGNGDWKFYWSNGQVSEEGKYKNGRKDGTWYKYREDGSIDTVIKYDNGRLLSESWN